MALCKSCGEDKKHHAKGLCETCYYRIFSRTRTRKTIICKGCGENREHIAHGLCRECYSKNHYKTYVKPSNKIICKMCKQEKELGSRGMCSSCYKKLLRGTITDEGVKIVNTKCATYLGCDVAETVLSKVFHDVKIMPAGNPGFDFVCNKGKKIDVKSSCTKIHDNRRDRWAFNIDKNEIADYFICIAFDNREDLNPLYIWLIPAQRVNHLVSASISKSTLSRWDEYKMDITKTLKCCNDMKTGETI